jgi:hypothetical protein
MAFKKSKNGHGEHWLVVWNGILWRMIGEKDARIRRVNDKILTYEKRLRPCKVLLLNLTE